MAARPSLAVCVTLVLLSVASAERSLQAHRASGGTTLHAVAITGAGYYTTTGNGTWASRTNSAYQRQANCYGASSDRGPTFIGFLTSFFVKGGASITDVYFPSRLVGVAVGAGCSGFFGPYTDTNGASFGPSAATSYIPQILLTFDMGQSWQYATGFSTNVKSFAQTLQPLNSLPLASVGAATTAANAAPDLTSVFCATRSLCFAAGGYFGTERALGSVAPNRGSTTLPLGNGKRAAMTNPQVGSNPQIQPGVMPVAGTVLISTNGGTFWSYVTLPIAQAATPLLPAQPIPGLTDIASDASGRHVFAVGAPFFKFDYTPPTGSVPPFSVGPGQNNAYWTGTPTVPSTSATGTIIYSGNYGASNSWTLQAAPFIPNHWYSLSAVTVLRGTLAVAVGGSPLGLSINAYNNSLSSAPTGSITGPPTFTPAQAAPLLPSGVVLMTMNGGFRWMYQNLPSWSYWSPVFIGGGNGIGTFVYDTAEQASATLPALNDVACYHSTDAVTAASAYTCMAVGDWGYAVRTTVPYSSLSSSINAAQAPTWRTVNITQVAQTTGYLDLYGIVWDNNVVGYAFGASIIVSTHDGGNTWVTETPSGLVTSTAATDAVTGIATVPTTY